MSGVRDAAKDADLTLGGQPVQTPRGQLTPTWMMQGHTGGVEASAFFKDGRQVVTGSRDKTLRIWDVEKGELVGGPLEGQNGEVYSVAVSPDDRRIASGGSDNTIIIWDVESKADSIPSAGEAYTLGLVGVLLPRWQETASGSYDKTIDVWTAETGAVVATLKDRRDPVRSVA